MNYDQRQRWERDHLEICNPGELHFGLTTNKLTIPHESRPWNPTIAGVLHRAGVIERWGTGTLNIMTWCRENHNPMPEWSTQPRTLVTTFYPAADLGESQFLTGGSPKGSEKTPHETPLKTSEKGPESEAQVEITPPVTPPVETQDELAAPVEVPVEVSVTEAKILGTLQTLPCGRSELLKKLGYAKRTGNFTKAVSRLIQKGLIEMTIPDKPNSRLQKYRLTDKGRRLLKEHEV